MAVVYMHAEQGNKRVEPRVVFRTLNKGSEDESSYVDLTLKVLDGDGRATDEVVLFMATSAALLELASQIFEGAKGIIIQGAVDELEAVAK